MNLSSDFLTRQMLRKLFLMETEMEQKTKMEDRSLRGRQIACLIYEYFRVHGRTAETAHIGTSIWQIPYSTIITCWKIRFRKQVYLFWFSLGGNVMDHRGGDGRVNGWIESSRSVAGKNFPNFVLLDAKIASSLNKIIQNSFFKKQVSLEGQKAQKEDRFLRGR